MSIKTDYSEPTEVKCWWAPSEAAPLVPGTITRRAMTENDVVIAIKYAGICHTDIHLVSVFVHFVPHVLLLSSQNPS